MTPDWKRYPTQLLPPISSFGLTGNQFRGGATNPVAGQIVHEVAMRKAQDQLSASVLEYTTNHVPGNRNGNTEEQPEEGWES